MAFSFTSNNSRTEIIDCKGHCEHKTIRGNKEGFDAAIKELNGKEWKGRALCGE